MSEDIGVPRVGKGSPKGKRWFITGAPEASYTMVPEDQIPMERGTVHRQKARRIGFVKQVKPALFQGDGMLGTQNPSGTDRNDSPFWGVYVTEDQSVIDWLRKHPHYMQTQSNEARNVPKLAIIELDWDPRALTTGTGYGVMARGRSSISEPAKAPEAPEERKPAATAARVADMGGKGRG